MRILRSLPFLVATACAALSRRPPEESPSICREKALSVLPPEKLPPPIPALFRTSLQEIQPNYLLVLEDPGSLPPSELKTASERRALFITTLLLAIELVKRFYRERGVWGPNPFERSRTTLRLDPLVRVIGIWDLEKEPWFHKIEVASQIRGRKRLAFTHVSMPVGYNPVARVRVYFDLNRLRGAAEDLTGSPNGYRALMIAAFAHEVVGHVPLFLDGSGLGRPVDFLEGQATCRTVDFFKWLVAALKKSPDLAPGVRVEEVEALLEDHRSRLRSLPPLQVIRR